MSTVWDFPPECCPTSWDTPLSPCPFSWVQFTWTIEDPKIATVTADGLVTGVAKGKTVLKATVGDQSVSCFVIVN